ncbi:MAG TPA: PVC-type heme-binding CxxCH protein [Cyclobacteriaceae bacterium]|nr:PVC-type heme-binding CxxCH protein [Cyclobacteriaceae bacterium]
MIERLFFFVSLSAVLYSCSSGQSQNKNADGEEISSIENTTLHLVLDQDRETISVFRQDGQEALLTQDAKDDFRPYLHPILAPDGKGILTEYSPGHHKHQTGLYWGFTNVNGRDFFHNPGEGYWEKVALNVIEEQGEAVQWQTVYELLDEEGNVLLLETQTWTMRESNGRYHLDLEWKGEAKTDVTIGKYDYGGLFLRMPWKEGINGEVINAARQKNEKAEGQPAMWINVAMQVEDRDNMANISVFDHPENRSYPNQWRVDGQMGVGPSYTREEDWIIPEGKTETLKHQLVVHTGDFNDLDINDWWGEFSGKTGMYNATELWRIAQEEGRNAKFLQPWEAVEAMTVKEGYQVNVWAAEPMITQPMAFCWDDKGRLWVAENRDYESRGHGFSSAGNSRILILEDTDGDGEADSQKVFLEGLAFPAAIAVGFDGLYLGAPPNLLFVPDRNGDDKADMDDVEVLLTGWGIRDRHETLNSLHWGPDGWLYGLQGFATPSKIRKPKGEGQLFYHNDPFPDDLLEADGVDINGGVWRYHPVKDRFEVVAHGFSNPWGIDYDAKGQLFITACVIPHLWHIVPGGIYHRQGGQHFNPYVYDDIKTITDHSHRSAHGGARIYQSDAFPAEEKGRIFMANIHEHAVLSDILEPVGSGFVGRHGDDFVTANNAQWVGFSMEIGPDGGLYALDWHDADICGQDVLNSETGRIFRTMPVNSLAKDFKGRYEDLNGLSDQALVELQKSTSDWHSRRARGILHKRAVKGTLKKETTDALMIIFDSESRPDIRLRAMWSLHQVGGFDERRLLQALEDRDEHVRAWAIQLLCEDMDPSKEAKAKFIQMAKQDASAVVRLYLASALQRIPTEETWTIASNLLQHAEDREDHNLPKMIWYGIEPMMEKDPAKFLGLSNQSSIPFVTILIARRAVDGDKLELLVKTIDQAGANTPLLLEGMLSGMEGRTDLTAPTNWTASARKLQQTSAENKALALAISDLFGDREATLRALATLKDTKAPLEQRTRALKLLAAQQNASLGTEIPRLLKDGRLRLEAIRAVAAYDNESLGRLLVQSYKDFSPSEKIETIQTLSSRPRYGGMLVEEIKENRIPKREISPTVARQLLRVVGSGFIEIWGSIESVAKDEAAYQKYRDILLPEALAKADLKKGKAIFQNVCGPCHKMYGEGQVMGPDLTGSNRSNIDYILLNVLDPSAEIQDDYRMVVITTRDGRNYSGNVIAENNRQLTLRVVGQDPVIINKSTIQSREVTPVSMMPMGLFENLLEQEIIELVAYLGTNKRID